MAKFDLRNLPKGFRFLFTLKEIKEIENFAGIEFHKVINGNLTNSEKLENDPFFRVFSIQGKMVGEIWKFSLHQNGFREELLPKIYEEKIYTLSNDKIKEYLNRVYNSKETDLYKNPQLRAYINIRKGKAEVTWSETK
jgi:hypothetical protein